MDPCNDKMDYDLSDTETQPPDDPQSPGGEVENQSYDQAELRNIHDTVAIDDINDCGDAFETQLLDAYDDMPVMDFLNETELVAEEDITVVDVLNETQLVGDEDTQRVEETQVVDLAGETQRVEELDCEAYMGTQILDDNDVYDSDRTEVVYDTEEASDDDSMKNLVVHTSSNAEKAPHKEDEASTAGERQSGSSFSDFTTIRVASTIASGLAAQRMARERLNGKSVSVRNSPNAVKEASQITDQDGKTEQMKEPINESRFNISSSTVRKLFPENTTPETVQPDGGMNESSDGDLPEFENGMSGLSYVNSQEPGELSQANALEFVDNLLKFDINENDKEVEIRKSNLGNYKVISSLEGVRRLAATPGTPFENKAAFDWDDNCEDECGGEFFRKKKDLFFDNGIQKFKSLTQPRKPSLDSRKGKAIETCGGQRADHLVINKNSRRPPKSDSRIGLHKTKGSGNSSKLVENLSKDLNKQFSASDDKVLETNTRKNETHLLDVGPDTQIAAEAMETLGIAMPGNDLSKDCQEVVRRQSRRTRSSVVLSREDTSPRRENVKTRSELTRSKFSKAKQMVTPKGLSEDDCGNSNNECSASFEQVKGKRISKRNVDDAAGKEKKEFGLQEHLSSLTPVARRTRQQQKVDEINSAGKDIIHSTRKRSRRDTNPTESLLTPVEVSDDQFDPRGSGTRGLLKFDVIEHPRGRRTRRKVQPNKEESESRRLRSGSTSAVKGVTNAGSNKDNDPEVKGTEASVIVDSSPICMGDEYEKQSCRKRLSRSPLVKELNSLIMSGGKSVMPDSRRRREITDLRVLFSHHLDADVIRQQKKVLSRLGASEVSSMSDATHFITDQFVRTQNMLEAIALGKPVVTHLWLRSCGQASCVIDEKNFILRDARKEKEIGFNMPVSLARACQHPLLQGQRVLITPNTKPGKEILASLVKAVHGLAIERLGRSVTKNEKLPDDLLILSCDEDYETCIPFLEKGSAVYSSELLLNGIVIQKLEYDRHRLFLDSVKVTRSKIWVKKKRT